MPGKHRWDGIQQFMKGLQDYLGYYVAGAIPIEFKIAAGAAVADYDGALVIVDKAYELVAAYERHAVLGAAATLMLKKVASGTAKAAGTDMLAAGFSAAAAANTTQTGTLSATVANRKLAVGEGLGLELSGASAGLDGVSVTAWVKALEK